MNILIIEESKTISQLVKKSLEAQGFDITIDSKNFYNKTFVKKKVFDVVIINTNLPGRYTLDILISVRKVDKEIKILGLCSHGGWKDKVSFLKNGGDDVVSYPFPIQELVERINSLQRRPKSYIDGSLYIGEYCLDKDNFSIKDKEKDIKLRKKEFELLEYLVRHKDRIVSRCELLDHVWDYREYIGSNTIDVHIKRLRDKLDHKDIIRTIHGRGYKVMEYKPRSSLA
ncbi:MAG: response regulator transcription factor [Candidatus Dojkabacteria bacterium]|jgi:DNA-binding response OmpR family regulator|nr:response regulator transcription factor [Candidatus Dojkabacteria bacterium]MDD2270302.1 response regulator transcription factor [Candidatus Dojkabacteria bacterium]